MQPLCQRLKWLRKLSSLAQTLAAGAKERNTPAYCGIKLAGSAPIFQVAEL
jgi:hypothetical protein